MSIDTNNHESSRQGAKTPRLIALRLGVFA